MYMYILTSLRNIRRNLNSSNELGKNWRYQFLWSVSLPFNNMLVIRCDACWPRNKKKAVCNHPNYKSELIDNLPRVINPGLVIEGKLFHASRNKFETIIVKLRFNFFLSFWIKLKQYGMPLFRIDLESKISLGLALIGLEAIWW